MFQSLFIFASIFALGLLAAIVFETIRRKYNHTYAPSPPKNWEQSGFLLKTYPYSSYFWCLEYYVGSHVEAPPIFEDPNSLKPVCIKKIICILMHSHHYLAFYYLDFFISVWKLNNEYILKFWVSFKYFEVLGLLEITYAGYCGLMKYRWLILLYVYFNIWSPYRWLLFG